MQEGSETPAVKATKIKADDNPWYLLATLHGNPREADRELSDKNRVAWNRYFAANLDEHDRARLIEEKRHPKEELVPLSSEDLKNIEAVFAKRSAPLRSSFQQTTL